MINAKTRTLANCKQATCARRSSASNRHGIMAVTFDLWETLLFENDGANRRRRAARCENLSRTLSEFGGKLTTRQVQAAMEKTESSLLEMWASDKDVSHMEQLELLVEHASKGSCSLRKEWVKKLSSAYVAPLFQLPPHLNPDAVEVVSLLKGRGKRIGLICNTGLTPGAGLRKFLSTAGIGGFFDMMIFSDELGIRKPDQVIFHMAAEELGTRPLETVHVGDNLRVDVWGANNAGFKTIHFASDVGRDKVAEADPKSPVAISRQLRGLDRMEIAPTKTVTSFSKVIEAIEEVERVD